MSVVSVLRFHAGATTYALAADHVTRIGAPRPEAPHLAELFGGTPRSAEDARLLHVSAGGRVVELRVDGPVDVVPIEAADISPCTSLTSASVLGFARCAGTLVVLLDVVSLVDQVSNRGETT